MYICSECKAIFDTPALVDTDLEEYQGMPVRRQEGRCPECGSDDYEPILNISLKIRNVLEEYGLELDDLDDLSRYL